MIGNIYNYILTFTVPYKDYLYIWMNNILYKKPAKRINQDANFIARVLSYIDEPVKIIENIYLGHLLNASNYNKLKELNIDSIVNVTCELSNYYENDFHYYNILIKDELDSCFDNEIENCISFIHEKVTNNKNVLVHCSQGRSRSVTIIAAYLMKYKNLSFEQAYNYIKSKKQIINMNTNFKQILKDTQFSEI